MEKNQTPATAYVILETRWPNAKQIYKIKLMVTHKRVQKFYTIVIPGVPASMTEDEFSKIKLDKPRKPFSDYKERISCVETDARKVIMNLDEFSFEEFQVKYFEPAKEEKSLFNSIEVYIKELKQQARVGTASSYNCTLSSLTKFKNEKKLQPLIFDNITVDFLNTWEQWMLSAGNSLTTIGIYARNIRAILNKAKAAGLMKPENYPFGKGKFEIPAGSNVKKALTLAEVGKIYNYISPPDSSEGRARDLWIFSYLCNGINVKDIARMKYKNIDRDSIVFVRAKTERKQRQNQKSIVVPLTPEIKRIIKRSGNKLTSMDEYVFPILHDGLTPEKERALIQQATKTINKYIKRIVDDLKIKKEVTTYTARHSFATVLKRSGASTEFISESLGHSNLTTTENYLASFEMVTKRRIAKNLTKF
jgi:integrase/recombinase XerD